MTFENRNEIRTFSCPECFLCGSQGTLLYHGLKDRLFGAPGEWNFKKCQNSECGLVWLDPVPIEEDIGKAYQNYFTHQDLVHTSDMGQLNNSLVNDSYIALRYGYHPKLLSTWKEFWGMLMYLEVRIRPKADLSVMYLPAKPGGRLLEVGCGSGLMLKRMFDLGWLVEGVDFDPVAVENSRRKGLQVRLGTMEEQEYPDNHFDAITMIHLIEHVHEPTRLLCECYRVIKPGGRLVIVTPNIESLGHQLFKASCFHLDPPRHLHLFSLSSLRQLIEKAGFHTSKALTTIREADGLFIASRSIDRTGEHVWGRQYPFPILLWARGMQFLEWALLKIKRDVGEEIVLIAEK